MSDRERRTAAPPLGDADGVRIVERNPRGRRVMVFYLALFVVACFAGYAVTRRPSATLPALSGEPDALPSTVHPRSVEKEVASASRSSHATAATPDPVRSVPVPRRLPPRAIERDAQGDTSLDLSDFIPPGERPTAAQVIEELHDRGIYEGLGAFPPPGTSPPMVGLAVPDDFELPQGYVRHYQTTDDGQDIEPILMFSPDYEFVDENGNPVPVPDNRVVPPELAPPGLPIREIDIPPDRESRRLAH